MKITYFVGSCLAIFNIMLASFAEAREVQVRALCFKSGFPLELHAHEPSGSSTAGLLPLKSFLNHEKNTLKFEGTRLVFTRRSAPASATSVDETIGAVEIPPEMDSTILLFIPEPANGNKDRYEVIPVGDSGKSFPAGTYKVANLAKLPVKVEVGGDSHEFEPGEMKVIAKINYGENQAADMRAFAKKEDRWQMVSSGVWSDPGSRRVLQIFTSDPVSGRVTLKGIRDNMVP